MRGYEIAPFALLIAEVVQKRSRVLERYDWRKPSPVV